MRELPILFSAEMVRAILSGKKTQTRRLFRPQPADHHWEGLTGHRHAVRLMATSTGLAARCSHWLGKHEDPAIQWVGSPFGTAGDRLWVRETWAALGAKNRAPFVYRADAPRGERVRVDAPWRPSIHMPRHASRLLLEVTEVHVQRLKDISDYDCRAEGCSGGHDSIPAYPFSATPREHFGHLWRSIYGTDSWESNPWVWVVEFSRVEGSR